MKHLICIGFLATAAVGCGTDPSSGNDGEAPAGDGGADAGGSRADAAPAAPLPDAAPSGGSADAAPAAPLLDAAPSGGSADADPDAPPPDATPGGSADAAPAGATFGFFVTSAGTGEAGGDYGGLAGADARCQSLAAAVGGGGRTWRAYLSTSSAFGGVVVDARDRIGSGPWTDVNGVLVAADVAALHANGVAEARMLDETGGPIPVNEHDLLTGSDADGRVTTRVATADPATCANWTSNAHGTYGFVGHTNSGPEAWNSAHDSRCSQQGLQGVNGSGRIMCFAAD